MKSLILDRASEIVCGDRQADYGPPNADFECAAQMLSAYITRRKGVVIKLDAEDLPAIMILIKMSRLAHKTKIDSIIDLAGYAECWGQVITPPVPTEKPSSG